MSTTKRVSVSQRSPLDDLIRKTESPSQTPKTESADLERESPADVPANLRQTTILLSDDHLDWLDQKCTEARRAGGKPIRKAVLIRSLLDIAMNAPVDLKGLASEEQLVEKLEQAIKSK